jgi:hypothetical protein
MSTQKNLAFESLETRALLAADLHAAVTPPVAENGSECNFDAGYLPGDANCDGKFDSSDIVAIMQAGEFEDNEPIYYQGELLFIRNLGNSAWHEGDFDNDQDVTSSDLVLAMQENFYDRGDNGGSRFPWDVNHDGRFNSSDLVIVMQAGEYEDNVPLFSEDGELKGFENAKNSTSLEGDWNGDLEFTSADWVLAMQSGQYEDA